MKPLFLLVLLAAAGCSKPESSTPAPAPPGAKIYAVTGIIQEIPADRRHATIKHEKIPGYMAAMTMDFRVKNTNELAGLGPNDEITFKLVVTKDDDWIEDVRFVSHHIGAVTNNVFTFHVETAELKPGDTLPDYEFTGEDGRQFRFSNFRGKALAFTFFFTSCPLPEYCPRMNKNFSEARKILLADPNAPANWQLLSISFDSAFDRPELLANYGGFYRGGDPNRWFFSVASTNTLAELGPQVDLRFWREGQ